MKNSKLFIAIFFLLGLGYVLLILSQNLLLHILNIYSETKLQMSFGIGLYYGRIFFAIILFVSLLSNLLKFNKMKRVLMFLLFSAYVYYWIPLFKQYPFKTFSILLISFVIFFLINYIMYRLNRMDL